MMITVVCWIALLMVTAVHGHSFGAPSGACKDIAPQHGLLPSTISAPYEVVMGEFPCQNYIPTKVYKLILKSTADSDGFKGFMIQARRMADDSAVGTWEVSPPLYKAVCSGNTAATHTGNSKKTFVILLWKAPPAGTGAIRFRYAFVSSYATYWENLYTEAIHEADKVECIPTAAVVPTRTIAAVPSVNIPKSLSLVPVPTSSSSFSFLSPTLSIPAPTPAVEVPFSCENITGYPKCSPDFCKSHRSKFARCSARVESCSTCQVTTCGVCFFVNKPIELPKECFEGVCTFRQCVVKWSRCAHDKLIPLQMKESERKPENFKCFVPNCY